jgi:hypothetical protein
VLKVPYSVTRVAPGLRYGIFPDTVGVEVDEIVIGVVCVTVKISGDE